MKLTVDSIISRRTCPKELESRIRELFGPDGLTPLEVLALNIPIGDRAWILLGESVFPERSLHLIACDIGHYTLSLVDSPDPRSVEVIRVKRLWVDRKVTDEKLKAAREAAWAAASEIAWEATGDASRESSREAAWAAARVASGESVGYAGWEVARIAARIVVRIVARATREEEKLAEEKIISIIKKYL